jgi:uracil-DNA glycosylase
MSLQQEWQGLIDQTKDYLRQHWSDGVVLQDPAVLVNLTATVPAARPTVSAGPQTLQAFRESIQNCQQCSLGATRKHFVFGNGDPQARVLFIGEAPGREEDESGQVFVGEAGQLLTKIIAAIKFTRDEVYIANVLKCRPPQNRDPLLEEIEHCKKHLFRQIEIIKPLVICTLGRFAAQTLLGSSQSMQQLRSTVHNFQGVPVVATFHPAALLRNPDWKRLAWEDVQQLRKLYDEKVKKHGQR